MKHRYSSLTAVCLHCFLTKQEVFDAGDPPCAGSPAVSVTSIIRQLDAEKAGELPPKYPPPDSAEADPCSVVFSQPLLT